MIQARIRSGSLLINDEEEDLKIENEINYPFGPINDNEDSLSSSSFGDETMYTRIKEKHHQN